MAAPEEQDLTQEQTEKLLQFQVAASSRCSRGRRGMGSGTLEERKIILRLGLGPFSDPQAAPSPPDANCPDFPGAQPLWVPSLQPPLPARLDHSGSAALITLAAWVRNPCQPD